MDLRSIINTEVGDNSTDKQATLVTPVKESPGEISGGYDYTVHASLDKNFLHEYGQQRTEQTHAATYQQNYQYRRGPPLPIQVPPPNELRSNNQPVLVSSPYQLTLSSTTTQFPFPPNHQTPESPAQSYKYIAEVKKTDSSQYSNPSHNIENKDIYSQSSTTPQSPLGSSLGTSQLYVEYQRSESSTSNSSSHHTQQKYISNNYTQNTSALAGSSSLHSQHQHQQTQKSQPTSTLGPPLTHTLAVKTLPPLSGYTQKTTSGPLPQHQQISPLHSDSDSYEQLTRTSISHHRPMKPINEQSHRLRIENRNRSVSSSPKTRMSNIQTKEFSSDSEREPTSILKTRTDKELGDNMSESGPNQTANKPISSEIGSHMYGDLHSSPASTQQPVRKRTRYSEPPIWARSIKTHGHLIQAHQDSFQWKERQPAVEAIPTKAQLQAKPNGNGAASMPSKTATIESHLPSMLGNPEECITGKKPIEHMVKAVADFLYLHVVSRSDLGELSAKGVQIEVEAKLGELIDKDTNQRFFLPVRSECILADNLRVGFKSSMTEKQHQRLNEFLNEQVKRTHQSNPNAKSRVKIDYLHRREVDKFYEIPKAMQAALPTAIKEQIPFYHSAKLRVTHDQKSNKVLAKIIKARVSSLDIYSGLSGTLDCRISINLEMPFDEEFDELISNGKTSSQSPDRSKDRLSYTQRYYQVDLTQVTQNVIVNNILRTEKEHELEIEISANAIMDHGHRATEGHPNEFLPLVEGLLNNVRVLSRFVAEVK